VDLEKGLLAVRHSWDAPLPKDGDARDVLVVRELRPHLEAAMAASKSDHLFVRPDGKPYRPDDRFNLVDHLRRALKHAGIVDGYRFVCRRKGCGFEETRPAPGEDRCPRCSMRLWVSPLPRELRFYDLRHTHATLLRKAGVHLGAVQLSLGHSSPEITAAVYDHSDVEDYRDQVERALTFEPAKVNAPEMQPGGSGEGEGRDALGNPRNIAAFNGRGDWI
jgi:integrase